MLKKSTNYEYSPAVVFFKISTLHSPDTTANGQTK